MERRLGRGLGSLLSPSPPAAGQLELELDRIRPNPFQPRTVFDEAGLAELRTSIEAHGVLQPVVVRPAGGVERGFYELVSGERRWRASRLAGKTTIPAVVRPGVRDDEMLELALVENLQRRDLDPMERARGFRQLLESLQGTQEQVAERVGLQRSTITNHLRLLELPRPVQDALAQGLLGMGHARALLGLGQEARQLELLEATVRDGLSVREVERRVRAAAPTGAVRSSQAAARPSAPAWVGDVEGRLRRSLGTKVRILNGPDGGGQIVIDFYDRAGLDNLLALLAPRKTL